MKVRAWMAAVVLMTAAGCGGGDDGGSDGGGGENGDSGGSVPSSSDAPRDATVEDFCATFEATSMTSGDEAAVELARTGTPSDIPDDARAGFEFLIDHPEGGEEVINNKDVSAYVTYGSKTCAAMINE